MNRLQLIIVSSIAFLAMVIIEIRGQDMPLFKSLRYDEDYSFLNADTSRSWYEGVKFAPLGKKQKSYISFGGEVRFQYFLDKNTDCGVMALKILLDMFCRGILRMLTFMPANIFARSCNCRVH